MYRIHHFDYKSLTLLLTAALLPTGTAQAQHHNPARAHHMTVQAHHARCSFSSAAAQPDGIHSSRMSASRAGRTSNPWTLSPSEGYQVAPGCCPQSPSSAGGSSFWSRWRQGWRSLMRWARGLLG